MFACRGDKTVKLLCSCTSVIQQSGAISTTEKFRSNENTLAVSASDFMIASDEAFCSR